MELKFGTEPTIEAYEALCKERDELLVRHNTCDNELRSAKLVSEKWMGEYLQRQQEARERFEQVQSEIGELKSGLQKKQFDFAEVVDDGIAYRAACDGEFGGYYNGDSLSQEEKLILLKADVKQLAKEKAASVESAVLSELINDVGSLSNEITMYMDSNPITSEMVGTGLNGIKGLDAKAKVAFSEIYRNRASELREAIDICWSLAKELAEMCPKVFKPRKVSEFGKILKEACDNGR